MVKYIKLYEQYVSSQTLENKINKILLNKKLFNKIELIYNSLPNKIKKYIQEYFNQDTINITKLIKIEKKYNIFNRVKKLYNKGIKDVNKILDILFPKNESIAFALIIIAAVIIIMGIVVLGLWAMNFALDNNNMSNDYLAIILAVVVFLAIIGGSAGTIFGAAVLTDKIEQKEMKEIPREERIENMIKNVKKVVVESGIRTDTLILYLDKHGDYKAKVITDDTQW